MVLILTYTIRAPYFVLPKVSQLCHKSKQFKIAEFCDCFSVALKLWNYRRGEEEAYEVDILLSHHDFHPGRKVRHTVRTLVNYAESSNKSVQKRSGSCLQRTELTRLHVFD
jgi:hypothetical protein